MALFVRKNLASLLFVAMVVALTPLLLRSFSSNPPLARTSAPGEGNCGSCHSGASGALIAISSASGTYTPGVAQRLTVTVGGGPNAVWGYEMTAVQAAATSTGAGTFASLDGNSSVRTGTGTNSTKSYAAQSNDLVNTYALNWTPPATSVGNVTFFASGVSGDASGDESGDAMATTSLTLTPAGAAVSVSISPTTASLITGATQPFTATVTGSSNTAVTWSATGGTVSSTGLYTAPATAGTFTVTATSVADTTKSASATVTVTVVSVAISPTTASLLTGATQQFTATVTGSSNTAVTWSATGGTVSTTGLYTAPATAGTFTVRATSVGDPTKSAAATVTVTVPVVVSVSISPTTASLLTGATQQFTATVTGSSNTAVTWSATGGTVSSTGLYTAPATAGTFTVTATSVADTTKSASATVTVTAVSVSIAPTTAALITGATQQFTATVTGSSNTAVTWSATGGTVSTTGLYTAPATAGTFTVRATSVADPTKSASATVTVTVVSVAISPTTASLLTGATQQFTATVTGSSNTAVTWSATGGTVSSTGLYTAPGTAGTFTVRATSVADPTKSAAATVTVTVPVVVSVSISPTTASLLTGATQQFTATVTGSSNTAVTWSATGGTVSSTGLYTAPATAGTFTVTATSVADTTKSASATVTVTVVSVAISPTTASLLTGATQQFTATVTGSSNTAVTWSATGGTVSTTGLYTAPATAGTFTVRATSVGDPTKSAAATVTVTVPVVVSVSISPTTASLLTGATQQFTATVTGSSNTAVTWSATGGTVSSTGLYTAPATAGTFTVTATSVADTTKSASATVTVTAVSVSIAPTTAALITGATQQFTATVTGSSNTAVTWSATGGTVSTTGLYTAPATAGTFTVRATSVADPTKSASATVTVTVVSVAISPTTASLLTGATQQFTATVTGSSNTAVTWSATGGTVSSTGLYTAPGTAGTFTVRATSVADPTKSAAATVTVTVPVVVSVSISPTTASLLTGATQQFTATVTGSSNTAVTWSATGGTVSSTGLYTAPATAGTFTVTATSVADPTKSAAATVTVTVPVVVAVSISPTTASLLTGATQQFTATVTGSSNTAVTWSATGGTVSSTGLYTAPATAGTFTVTATSVADATKSAAAKVTISNPGSASLIAMPRTLSFNSGHTGENGQLSKYIRVTSSGTPLAFTAEAVGGSWLSVSPSAGTTPARLKVTLFTDGLHRGRYTGQIHLTAPGASSLDVPIILAVVRSREDESDQNSISADTYTSDPANTGAVASTWVYGAGVPGDATDPTNQGLVLTNNASASSQARAGVILSNVEGLTLSTLGFDLRQGSLCSARGPRFVVVTNDDVVHTVGGCDSANAQAAPAKGWTRFRFDPSQASPAIAPSSTVKSIALMLDDGPDASGGMVVLDNINVNGTFVGRE